MSYLNSLFQESVTPGYSEMQERYLYIFLGVGSHEYRSWTVLSIEFNSRFRFTVGYNRPTKLTIDAFEGLELNYKVYTDVQLPLRDRSAGALWEISSNMLHRGVVVWCVIHTYWNYAIGLKHEPEVASMRVLPTDLVLKTYPCIDTIHSLYINTTCTWLRGR